MIAGTATAVKIRACVSLGSARAIPLVSRRVNQAANVARSEITGGRVKRSASQVSSASRKGNG